jgi:hypothetical protein
MPCYYPLTGYRSRTLSDNGKRPIVFNTSDGFVDMPVEVPCGRCIGCRLDYSRQWAIRCMHESQMHVDNAFVTLTYDEEHLPDDYSLDKRHLQLFFKRMRKALEPDRIRYFACGEYGDRKGRPHYHAIIFGWYPADAQLWRMRDGIRTYRSPLLETLWTYGHSEIGSVTFESCAYVARYVCKKIGGPLADKRYKDLTVVDRETGEIVREHVDQLPEFCLMSRRPGIGSTWFDKYRSDTDKDFVTSRGHKVGLPKYYDRKLEASDPEEFERRKKCRKYRAKTVAEDNTLERLRVKERVKKAQVQFLKRDFEGD